MCEQSALIVPVPEAENFVGRSRARLDPSAQLGVPAHITVLFPFMPPDQIDVAVIEQLAQLFAGFSRFSISLASIGWFGEEVVWLAPVPDTQLRHLTAAVYGRWPKWPPYEGLHGDPDPHLTIGDGADPADLARAAKSLEPELPIEAALTEVQLLCGDMGSASWQCLERFPFGA